MFFQLVYCSKANQHFTSADLLALLEQSKDYNASKNITGLLLYKDKSFIQLLEGDKKEILDLYREIEKDTRHRQVTRLIEKETDERHFPQWSMGFQHLDEDSDKVQGYSSFMKDTTLLTPERAGEVSELLDFFKLNS
ncbi:BLUF domain-containing protein [Alteromonas sp. KUL49]|uniref:BLUF domain-containing protein n=1 Tax=Alteromonas sp. KUL49 TaxID=2480798 RepID=UPI00102F1B88|nr:BLUF domain-containing protein [Alteromonas sp. KUL49]TAP39006.1 BLUF domain-containing protein [Alteromonas sp. KUL49]GEA12454.1 hypothetical protein KUL49_28290 [Alteromonas sp. KUL49]